MTDKACAFCVKRHVLATGQLECRARPPAVDVVFGRFPLVRDEDYCHGEFSRDASAEKTLTAAKDERARLDGLAAAPQARATEGDLDPGVHLSPPVVTPKRARRARTAAEPGSLL